VLTFLQELYNVKSTEIYFDRWIFDKLFEVILFSWQAAGADDFDESICIDENIAGMYISYFRTVFLKFRSCSNQIIEEIP